VIGLTTQETLATIERMAAIHAEFWLDSGLQEHSWLPDHGFWFSTPDQELVDDFFATCVKRFWDEKPCEKISRIAGTTCHPQSTPGVLPTTAKPDALLSVNNFQS
jgi:hypothetical protein